MPSLERQVEKALKDVKAYHRHGWNKKRTTYPLKAELRLLVLWGIYRDSSVPWIAEQACCSHTTVKATRSRLAHDLSILFDSLQLLELTLTGRKKLWRCEVCRRPMPGSEKKARIHVAEHFFTPDMVAQQGVGL